MRNTLIDWKCRNAFAGFHRNPRHCYRPVPPERKLVHNFGREILTVVKQIVTALYQRLSHP